MYTALTIPRGLYQFPILQFKMYSLTPECRTVLEQFLEPLLFQQELWPVSRSDSLVVQFDHSLRCTVTQEVHKSLS